MILRERDPFGIRQVVYHSRSATFGGGIRELLRQAQLPTGPLDSQAIGGYLTGARYADRTILADVRAVPPGHALVEASEGLAVIERPLRRTAGDLETLLLDALRDVLADGRPTAVALSGGLDSALILGLLHAHGIRHLPVYVLATGLPGYDEREAACDTARRRGVEVIVVEAGAQAFVDALPEAMRHLEEPLYNLHPVAKLLLARAMARDGIVRAITGDGVDQVLRRDRSADYLPLCRTLFEAAGVQLSAPFLATPVVAHLCSSPADPDKRCIRRLARHHGVSRALTEGPKRARLAPPMDLGHLLPAAPILALASVLGLPLPTLATDAERVQWATLLLLLRDLGVTA
ncbi:asparagine synthetase B family protein [Luteibacter sp. ME-Dv--P-043b]|jgi:hypothetical protein|uniref:asparagine synthase-related protein n=1 Tax=unclassified Luteibacter TaxID=2620188 RepID=UPI0025532C8F|nr:asparagine synthetase B family protein [Luteibacter sp. ME-Dv--P-043b]